MGIGTRDLFPPTLSSLNRKLPLTKADRRCETGSAFRIEKEDDLLCLRTNRGLLKIEPLHPQRFPIPNPLDPFLNLVLNPVGGKTAFIEFMGITDTVPNKNNRCLFGDFLKAERQNARRKERKRNKNEQNPLFDLEKAPPTGKILNK